ncbi:hypothetical protein FB384_003007 [Prauserella sediminis]|uniref:Glycosyltransferase RgtA/B/C/D-like domain-containing protein n=1 Tax=Prauserella sediminis TaxID=577680 RepID=A0A839XU58_9PSEU|nr:hypothetical protein [Prauserella sediminis]MBB3664103.1 hypothetical protein [Prauserella sediminis]
MHRRPFARMVARPPSASATSGRYDSPVTTSIEGPKLIRDQERRASADWRRVALLLAPALIYLAVRAAGVALLWVMSAANGQDFTLQHWDAGWYLQIAAGGYEQVDAGMTDAHGAHHSYTAMVFFPAYPQLLGLLFPEDPQLYLEFAVILSTAIGIVGAYGIARLARALGGNRSAELSAVALVAAAPMAIVYSMPYPEALLVAAVAWALAAMLERRWLTAGLCALVAGYTHPMGAPLVAVIVVAGLIAAYRGEGNGWRPALAAAIAPVGVGGYLLWVQFTSGVPGGYFAITREGWGNQLDLSYVGWIFDTLGTGREAYSVLSALLCLVVAAALVPAWRHLPVAVWAYTALVLLLTIGHAGAEHDRVRQLLSAFPLLVLLAVWAGRKRSPTGVGAIALMGAFGLWFSAYALVAQPHSI